jgi:hypothetical protein
LADLQCGVHPRASASASNIILKNALVGKKFLYLCGAILEIEKIELGCPLTRDEKVYRWEK